MNIQYWKNRCLLAERVIAESPCDHDITIGQIVAVSKWKKSIASEERDTESAVNKMGRMEFG